MYDSQIFENTETFEVDTPYGNPSDKIKIGDLRGIRVALLPRHGSRHTIPPHAINFRANMYALKKLGVQRIIATAAVGSMKGEMKPGDVVFPDSFVDFGKETVTYFDGPDVRHVSLADPFCYDLRSALKETAKDLNIPFHEKGVYLRISGPRFSTRAESMMFRQFADVIGMTAIPEAILARELGICYAVIATITDYDSWSEKTVSAKEVVKVMKENAAKTELILKSVFQRLPAERLCHCKEAPEKGKF